MALWRHAILELPPTEANDALRHQLVLRLAYGQMMAWRQTGDAGYLDDAKQLLERYLERHEQLFGTEEHAIAERGDVYEILYHVEQQLDPAAFDEAEGSEDGGASSQPAEDASEPTAVAASEPTAVAASEPTAAAAGEDEAAPRVDGDLAEQVAAVNATAKAEYREGGDRRLIVVRRDRETASREMLRSAFANPEGFVLTAPGFALVHGPRPLLRSGIAYTTEPTTTLASRARARRLGASLVEEARPALAECYDDAFMRDPIATARSTVELTVDEHGRVHDAAIVEGNLVDMLGDLCLVQQLERTQLTDDAGPARIRVPLTFFYQGPVLINEGTGETIPLAIAELLQWFSPPTAAPPR